jgi:diguanylate cyclase (GGDEF)-like protein/PAS domain S-box-containing protein
MLFRAFALQSLKTRITLFTLLIFVASIWVLTWTTGLILRDDMQRQLGEQQFSVASLLAADLDREVDDRLKALELIATGISQAAIKNPAELQDLLEHRPLLQPLFNDGVAVGDSAGTVLADVPHVSGRIGANFGERDYITGPLKEGRATIGKTVRSKLTQDPSLAMAVPIRDGAQKVIGVLAGVTNLGKPNFLDRIARNVYGKSGGYLLVESKHRQVVTATDKRRIMESLPPVGVNPVVDRFNAGFQGSAIFTNPSGVEVLASTKALASAQWYVVAVLPTAEAFAPIRSMQQRMLLAATLLTALTAALVWWMLRRQLAPMVDAGRALASLENSTRALQPVPIVRNDEIGVLIGGFNRLLEVLQQREEALRQSEERWKFAVDGSGDGLWDWDLQTGQAFYSHRYKEMLGFSDAEFGNSADEWSKRIHPEDAPGVMLTLQPYLEGRDGPVTMEFRMLSKDGCWRWMLGRGLVVARDAKGKPLRMIGTNSDISARLHAQAALRASESRFRGVFEKAYAGMAVADAGGTLQDANEFLARMLGYAREELIGMNIADFTHADDSAEERVYLRQLSLGKRDDYRMNKRYLTRSGGLIWVDLLVTVVRDFSGGVANVIGLVVDISERIRSEEKLRLAAGVFSHAREGITITDASGTIVDVNEAFTRITGYAREEALGRNPRFLKSGRQDQVFYQAMWGALLAHGHWTGEIWNTHKNGSLFAEMINISAVRDARGVTQQYVALFSDITALKEHQNQLEHIAHFDSLTNLPNRVLLADRLQQAMVQAQRRGQQLAVTYLDLDGFKAINDQYGHDAGDQVLIALAIRMKQALREGDTLARIGGDEFVAVLIDLEDVSASVPLLARLLAAAAHPMQVGSQTLQVSASLGVTFYPQVQEMDAEQLLRQADQAMYQAKLLGKNRYHVFDAAHDSSLRVHHESLEGIRLALERGEFVLHYQPKVNMRTGQVVGAEALIRWQHPERGLLAPGVFLPAIEDDPLAVVIGEWVIDSALAQMARWQTLGLEIAVSVNIGARQLQQSNFVERLCHILAAHPQVPAGQLGLEVLETSALADIAQVSQVIEACAQFGVYFALDDFGTGYSSLTYLKRLRVALLKIDQSFVRDMLDDPDDLAILEGIIGLAAAFKRDVIAEGVETVAHGNLLLQLGCELAQGYGIARPMPAGSFPAWAATWKPEPTWQDLFQGSE